MEKKLTNRGPLREPADKHSIYTFEITSNGFRSAEQGAECELYDALADAWDAAACGRPVTLRDSALLRLASVHATRAACEAVERAYHAAGSVALFDASPLQRTLRDVHAVRQPMMVADRYRQDVGRVLLGLEPQEPLL